MPHNFRVRPESSCGFTLAAMDSDNAAADVASSVLIRGSMDFSWQLIRSDTGIISRKHLEKVELMAVLFLKIMKLSIK
jgi:hypothetical protein